MIQAGEKWLEVEVPFLDLPVIKQLDEATLNAVLDALFNQIVLMIDVTAIKFVNQELQTKWSAASEALGLIAQEQGPTSDAYKQALSVAAADFSNWVHTGL